jgi:hypothetical protein
MSLLWVLALLVGVTCALVVAALVRMAGDRTGLRERAEDKGADDE